MSHTSKAKFIRHVNIFKVRRSGVQVASTDSKSYYIAARYFKTNSFPKTSTCQKCQCLCAIIVQSTWLHQISSAQNWLSNRAAGIATFSRVSPSFERNLLQLQFCCQLPVSTLFRATCGLVCVEAMTIGNRSDHRTMFERRVPDNSGNSSLQAQSSLPKRTVLALVDCPLDGQPDTARQELATSRRPSTEVGQQSALSLGASSALRTPRIC